MDRKEDFGTERIGDSVPPRPWEILVLSIDALGGESDFESRIFDGRESRELD